MNIATGRTSRRTTLLLLATFVCLGALVAAPAVANADTIYVDIARGHDGIGNGSSARPYQTITKGLAEASYWDTVKVARGTYSPALGETLPLVLPLGVTLQGDTSPRFAYWPNMLDTVIEGDDTAPIMQINGGDENTIVDGIAFTENSTLVNGAGIDVIGGRAPGGGPQIRDCYFYGLSAPAGGAIHATKFAYPSCEPRIERCTFYMCATDSGPVDGGAIYISDGDLWLSDTAFYACAANGAASNGGAVALRSPGSSLIMGCWFIGCTSPNNTGGAIDALGHSVGIFSSRFFNNSAGFGGAVYFQDNAAGDDDTIAIYNSLFAANSVSGAGPIGAAVRIYHGDAILSGCTITENSGAPVVAQYQSDTRIYNSIVWNEAEDDLHSSGGALTVGYSCVHDAADAGVGVIHSDPQFSFAGGDVRLLPTSPCIDSGSNAYASTTDIEDLPRVVDGNSDGVDTVDMGAYERNPIVDRAAGSNRYETAVTASEEHFDHAETVVLATGSSFPDALCAAPLAGIFESPVLLTPTTSLAPAVATELQRLEAEKVYVIGGTGAVSENVVNSLLASGYEVERLWGPDRYATSQAVVLEINSLTLGGLPPDTFIVARGDAFPDALSASPFAYRGIIPILLTRPNQLPGGFASTVTDLGFFDSIVVGGTAAVSATVAADVDALIPGTVDRLAGANRYETSVAIARFAVEDPFWGGILREDYAGLAVGNNFPDALCGGAATGAMGGPLLLVGENTLPAPVASYLTDYADALAHVQAFGGTAAVSDSVLTAVRGLIP